MSTTRPVVRDVARDVVRAIIRGESGGITPTKTNVFIAVGDSLTDNASSGDILSMSSAWVWTIAQAGFDYYVLDDAGVAGQTVGDIEARFQVDVVDKNPDVVQYLGGANNIGTAMTPQEIYDVIVDTLNLLPSTTPVLVGYVPYRTQSVGGMTPQEVTDKTDALNAIIATINSDVSNAYPVGPYTEYDALPLEGNGDKGGTFDGLHWNYQGAYSAALRYAPVLAQRSPSLPIDNDLLLNSELAGTGGTIRFGASGVIADDWRGNQAIYSVSSGVQTMTVSASVSALFDQINTDVSAYIGQTCQASIEIEIVSGSLNLSQINYRTRIDTGGTTVNSYCTLLDDLFTTTIDGKFRMVTQPFDVGTNTLLDSLLTVVANSGGPVTIKISKPKVYVMA